MESGWQGVAQAMDGLICGCRSLVENSKVDSLFTRSQSHAPSLIGHSNWLCRGQVALHWGQTALLLGRSQDKPQGDSWKHWSHYLLTLLPQCSDIHLSTLRHRSQRSHHHLDLCTSRASRSFITQTSPVRFLYFPGDHF